MHINSYIAFITIYDGYMVMDAINLVKKINLKKIESL